MAQRHRAKTILVIEDEADVRNFAARVLELEGYGVLRAEDGDEGLRLVREHQPALVLLDLKLPGHNGWAVLEEMKSSPDLSAIPVIVFTASASGGDRVLNMGAVEFLVKPLSAAVLREAVARVLRRKR